jgi:carboxyl-terminal processing protease
MKTLRRISFIGLLLVVLVFGMSGGILLDRAATSVAASPDAVEPAAQLNFPLIREAWDTIQKHYVDRSAVDSAHLTYGALSGMVSALGDTGHSVFLSPEMVKQEHNYTQGQFEGIGAEVQQKDGNVLIVAPMDGSPAQKAGVRPREIIAKVDGQDMSGLTLEQVVSHVLGPAGSKVTLTLRDPETGLTRDVIITRARIDVAPVTWQFLPGSKIAHVRIAAFSQGVSADLQKALADAQKQGATALIVDLRNNPGGLLDGAVGVTSQFLKDGNVLLEKDAQEKTTPVAVKGKLPKTDLPMVVLINAGSASAAEIVAGAIQDAQRAKLMGEPSFGTGTVLTEFPLSDGSALMLAVQEWLTPKGRVIWHQGIAPDVEVMQPANVATLLPDQEKGMTVDQLRASGDAQLLAAFDMLNRR